MNINFEYFKVFYYVAKNKNISKAANELMISQPAISKTLKNLEEQIGCPLFSRNKNGVSLTEEGIVLYNEVKNAIEIIDNANSRVNEMIDLESGILNIGISNTLTKQFLMPYIKEFNSRYPKVKLKIHTEPTYELIKKTRNGLVDFIILNLPYSIPDDFEKENLKVIHDCFVASNSFNELKNKTISLNDLNNYPLILLAKGSNGRYFLDDICSRLNVKLNPKFELASYSLVNEFIKAGIGIGLVTREFALDELKSGSLIEVNIKPSIPNRHIGLIYLRNKSFNRCSSKFLESLKEDL